MRSGSILERGVNTPTGKLELYSERIAAHPEWGLDALPTYRPPYNPDPEQYPFLLCAGTRIPNALHSRLHDVPWERSLLPDPVVEMSMEDAERLGIELGDPVEITTSVGSLTFQALPTATVQPGRSISIMAIGNWISTAFWTVRRWTPIRDSRPIAAPAAM